MIEGTNQQETEHELRLLKAAGVQIVWSVFEVLHIANGIRDTRHTLRLAKNFPTHEQAVLHVATQIDKISIRSSLIIMKRYLSSKKKPFPYLTKSRNL